MQSEIKYVSKKYILTWKANRMMKACLYILQSLNLEAQHEHTHNSLEKNRCCVCLANPIAGAKLFFPFWSRNKHVICSKQSQKIGLLVPRTVFLLPLSFTVKWEKKNPTETFKEIIVLKQEQKIPRKYFMKNSLKNYPKVFCQRNPQMEKKHLPEKTPLLFGKYLDSSFFQKFVHRWEVA